MAIVIDMKSKKKLEMPTEFALKVGALDKLGLLEAMEKFQDKRGKLGLSVKMMEEGIVLYSAIMAKAETEALKEVCTTTLLDLQTHLDKYNKCWK